MPKRAVFERSRRELSLDVSVDVHILLVVEQSSLESQSRGCAKTPWKVSLGGVPRLRYLLRYYSINSIRHSVRQPAFSRGFGCRHCCWGCPASGL